MFAEEANTAALTPTLLQQANIFVGIFRTNAILPVFLYKR